MNIVEGAIDYVRNKALEIKKDPTWTDIPFKKKKDFMTRMQEAEKVLAKYPDRIPIICERANTDAPRLDRSKYLVPADISMGEFMYVIRKRMKILPEVSIYLFVGNDSLAPVSHTMGMIYNKHKDEDKFLYVRYSGEATFG